MTVCHDFQHKWLDHLYDLLEEPEQRELLDHLAKCPACQATLEQARKQKELLGRAARLTFPEVKFTPPVAETLRPAEKVEVISHSRDSTPWARYALAAGVLLALGLGAIPTVGAIRANREAQNLILAHNRAVGEARSELEQADRELQTVSQDRDRKFQEIQQEIQSRQLRLLVTGPRTIQAGAPTEYQVKAVDAAGQPIDADIVARLTTSEPSSKANLADARSPAAAALAGENKVVTNISPPVPASAPVSGADLTVANIGPGTYKVRIPPTVRLQPGQSLGMLVAGNRKGGIAPPEGKKEQVQIRGEVQLVAPVFLTHLTTDKPMYQPGETVYFRSLTLDRGTMTPASEDFVLQYQVTMPTGAVLQVARGRNNLLHVDDKDNPVSLNGPDGKPIRGIGAGDFTLEPDAPGGEYTLTVTDEQGRFQPTTRKFLVNRYQKPRLDKKLDFNRSTYGAGDAVQAKVTALRADGGPVKNRPVEITVNVDDHLYDANGNDSGAPFHSQTDADGAVLVRFTLPRNISRGQATLSVKFDDGGNVETLIRPIPVVLKKLDVEFFPEGGDLVAGLPNRVYFQARTPLGKPAQLRGTLLEDGAPLSVEVATLHDDDQPGVNQGNGVFTFTPRAGKSYSLQIDSPQGIAERKPLPKSREDGVILSVTPGVLAAGEPIKAQVRSIQPRKLMIGAYCRGQLLDMVEVPGNATEVTLKPTSTAGGVCRITVFEQVQPGQPQDQLKPIAERLVYRHPKGRLNVAIQPGQPSYVPGQKAKVSLTTTNEEKKTTPAIALVAVVDKSVLTLADEKTARTMPTHFLLTTEIRRAEDLEYADFLLGDHPQASQALDLLLGTQGWRRFAEQNPEQFRDRLRKEAEKLPDNQRLQQEQDAERILVLTGQSTPMTTDFDEEKALEVERVFEEKSVQLMEKREQARVRLEDESREKVKIKAAQALLARHESLIEDVKVAATRLLPVLAGLFLVGGLIIILVNRSIRGLAFAGIGGICGVLFLMNGLDPLEKPGIATRSNREIAMAPRGFDKGADAAVMQAVPMAAPPPGAVDGNLAIVKDAAAKDDRGGLGGPGNMQAPGLGGIGAEQGQKDLADRPEIANMARNRGGEPMAAEKGKELGRMEEKVAGLDEAKAPGAIRLNQPMMRQGGLVLGGQRDGMNQRFAGRGMNQQRDLGRAPVVGMGAQGFPGNGMAQGRPGIGGPGFPGMGGMAPPMAGRIPPAGFARPGGGLGMMGNFPGGPMAPGFFGPGGGGGRAMVPMAEPLVVREYAHVRPSGSTPGMRSDFAETLYWHPVLLLPDGHASLTFDLCDSVTSFQVGVFAHTLDGRLGSGTAEIASRLPFTLSPKVPVEVTSGDRIDLPVAISNNTPDPRQVELKLGTLNGLELLQGKQDERFEVLPEGRVRRLFGLKPTLQQGKASLILEGVTQPFASDSIRESIKIVPDGFPVTGSSSNLLEKSATHTVTLPQWLPGTLEAKVEVFPSTLADLQKGLEGLLQEPYGCFEQTSTTNYPNILVLDYLRTSDKSSPELEKRTRELLDRGYQKLVSFECQEPGKSSRRGYEWFGGQAPPHEALTAYGLLQFRDMARVHEVDRQMLERTRAYLMSQRDGKGGFKRNPQALDGFGRAPESTTNAYIVWSLTEGGKDDDVSKELDALLEQAKKSDDTYFLSLVSLALSNRDRKKEAVEVLQKVVKKQKADGEVEGATTSITGSGGRDLAVETTALATLGMMKSDPLAFVQPIRQAARWIGQQRSQGGTFGSTQATILALKALIAWTQANKRTAEAGTLRLFVGEEKVNELNFSAGADGTLTLVVPDVEKRLKPGMNRIRVEITGEKNVFPHTVGWAYRTRTPVSVPAAPVKLETRLARANMEEGDTVRLNVKVTNASGNPQGMAVAVIGLPAGLIVPEDLKQLKEYCRVPVDGKRPLLAAFEIKGRELVLYWRDMDKDQTIDLPVDLVARVPGVYRGPASRAYLYYNADQRHWIEPLTATIAAK